MKIAVLMLNLGGPRTLREVRPFLRDLFLDRETIELPGGWLGQQLIGRFIAWRKAPRSRANYRMIGGGSPLEQWTRQQGEGMKRRVEARLPVELLPLPCMRFWHPRAATAVREAMDWGAEHLVAFSQYPQYSSATTGGSLTDLRRALESEGCQAPLTVISSWHCQPTYIAALAECVREGVAASASSDPAKLKIIYSAHSLPMSVVEAGDPYPDQVRETAAAVHRTASVPSDYEITWQSKAGPVQWLGPATTERIKALPGEGCEHVVVVPIVFINDHIETLHELDIQLAETAAAVGLRFVRAPALNVRPTFLDALGEILGEHLEENLAVAPKEIVT